MLTTVFVNIGNAVILWRKRVEIGQRVENQERQIGLNTKREGARPVTTDKSCAPGPSAVGTGSSTKI